MKEFAKSVGIGLAIIVFILAGCVAVIGPFMILAHFTSDAVGIGALMVTALIGMAWLLGETW